MKTDSVTCNECGESNWKEILEQDYPERRRDRDRTVKHVYECRNCGAEGRYFEHNNGDGSPTTSGAMR